MSNAFAARTTHTHLRPGTCVCVALMLPMSHFKLPPEYLVADHGEFPHMSGEVVPEVEGRGYLGLTALLTLPLSTVAF